MAFSNVLRVVAKTISCRQLWWRRLVNDSLISQFQANVISFNFLANALLTYEAFVCLFLLFDQFD